VAFLPRKLSTQVFSQFLDVLELLDHIFRKHPIPYLLNVRGNGLCCLRELVCLYLQLI